MVTRIGLICVGREGERLDIAQKEVYEPAVRGIKNLEGVELVDPAGGIILKGSEVMETAKKLFDAEVDCVIYLPATWIVPPQLIDPIIKYPMPLGLWGIQIPAPFTSVGANVIHGTLEELNIKHRLFYSDTGDEPEVLEEIRCFARAAMVTRKLRFSRLGQIGGLSIGAYTTSADTNQIKAVFGIDVDHIDQLVLLEKARAISDDKVDKLVSEFKSKYNGIDAPEEAITRSMRVYAALKEIIDEYNLDYATVKCLGEFINAYVSCCAAISETNNDGVAIACQGNLNACISLHIFNLLSDEGGIMADVNIVTKKDRVAMMINCGTMATKLAKNPSEIRWACQEEGMCAAKWDEAEEELKSARGICPTFCCKPGKITFGTLGRKNGKYIMHIATGTAFEKPISEFAEKELWAHAYIKLDCDPKPFYENLRSNHSVAGYGDLKQELIELCELLDIEPMVN